jgi:hypothetical protein
MRTIRNAEYQLEHIMPTARKNGCKCPFSEKDFDSFIAGTWSHKKGCPSPSYECLPNPSVMEVLRHGVYTEPHFND